MCFWCFSNDFIPSSKYTWAFFRAFCCPLSIGFTRDSSCFTADSVSSIEELKLNCISLPFRQNCYDNLVILLANSFSWTAVTSYFSSSSKDISFLSTSCLEITDRSEKLLVFCFVHCKRYKVANLYWHMAWSKFIHTTHVLLIYHVSHEDTWHYIMYSLGAYFLSNSLCSNDRKYIFLWSYKSCWIETNLGQTRWYVIRAFQNSFGLLNNNYNVTSKQLYYIVIIILYKYLSNTNMIAHVYNYTLSELCA